jgi:hypothetical protein
MNKKLIFYINLNLRMVVSKGVNDANILKGFVTHSSANRLYFAFTNQGMMPA